MSTGYIHDPDVEAARPAYTDTAETQGWARPADPGAGKLATPITPDSYNRMMARLYAIGTMLGITYDPTNDDEIADALAERVNGIISHATDTGVVTTAHTRVVVGAGSSQASGTDSVVAGGLDNLASGNYSQVAGGSSNTASGTDSQVAGGAHNVASGSDSQIAGGYSHVASGIESQISGGNNHTAAGARSHIPGGKNVKIATTSPDMIAWGAEGAAPTVADTNQGHTGNIDLTDGSEHIKGDLVIGGDPNTRTGGTITHHADTGAIDADGMVSAAGGLTTQSGLASATYGTPWTATVNAVGGTVVVPFSASHPLVYAYATLTTIRVTCDKVQSNSRVYVSCDYRTGDGGFPVAIVSQGTGTFDVLLQTLSPGVDIESDVYLHFDVINPAS